MDEHRRFYETPSSSPRRSAPAVERNRDLIAAVLREWLPPTGLVLEIASGTGEHVVHFARLFPKLQWQPSDVHPVALRSIETWRQDSGLENIRAPLPIDAANPVWMMDAADAVLCINMVHIAPWSAALGLLDGSAKVLKPGGALILYGPWFQAGIATAPSNVEFDRQLRLRDPAWGLRHVEDFEVAASKRGLKLEQTRAMPANNLMLILRVDA